MNARGLTIIELLASTVMLAVLAAAALPVVRGVTIEKHALPVEPSVHTQVRATIESFDAAALAEIVRSKLLTYEDPDGLIVETNCEVITPETGR